MPQIDTQLCKDAGIDIPLICGAMYPCSNPELVAAASAAGGLGIIQPMSLTFVHKYGMREGIRYIRSLTNNPVGFNAIVEKTVKAYDKRMQNWIDIALEEGVRFFITALGDPGWVVRKVEATGGVVYHDVTERKWALKAIDSGVKGLICVNASAGGHAGALAAQTLYDSLADLGLPLVCAGGIGDGPGFVRALDQGYAGVQMGTRFIATTECNAHDDYKQAILKAKAEDIVLSDKISGVPCAIIRTPYIEKVGTKAGPIARWLLRGRRTKKWMRTFYSLTSIWQLRKASQKGMSYKDYWAAGKSVGAIGEVVPAAEVYREVLDAYRQAHSPKQVREST